MGNQIHGWNVAHKLQKRKLLIAINCVAGLSIFFFGYDQGIVASNQALQSQHALIIRSDPNTHTDSVHQV